MRLTNAGIRFFPNAAKHIRVGKATVITAVAAPTEPLQITAVPNNAPRKAENSVLDSLSPFPEKRPVRKSITISENRFRKNRISAYITDVILSSFVFTYPLRVPMTVIILRKFREKCRKQTSEKFSLMHYFGISEGMSSYAYVRLLFERNGIKYDRRIFCCKGRHI